MKDLMLLLADTLPLDLLLDKLESDIKEYKLTKSPEKLDFIQMNCIMISAKGAIDKAEGGLDEILRKQEELSLASKIFNTDKQ
jgi:hypothetical protein